MEAAAASTSKLQTDSTEQNLETDDDTQHLLHQLNNDDESRDCDPATDCQQPVANLIVGDPGCSYQRICAILRPEDSDEFLVKWPAIAEAFSLSREFIRISKRNLNLEMTHISDVVIEMLTNWRSRKSTEATVVALIEILHHNGFETMARNLRTEFMSDLVEPNEYVSAKNYKVLIGFILFCLVAVGGIVVSLIVTPSGPKFRSTLPLTPAYYIYRNLQHRAVMDKFRIFHSVPSTDVLVFQNASFELINQLVANQPTHDIEYTIRHGISTTQKHVTDVQKISQFDDLCKIRGTLSIHLINLCDNQFIWKATCGNFSSVTLWSSPNSSLVTENEVESLVQFENHTSSKIGWYKPLNNLILIVGERGLGKSTLLAHIGANLSDRKSNTVIIFSDINVFIIKLRKYIRLGQNLKPAILKVMADIKCLNQVCRHLFQNNHIGSFDLLVLFNAFDQIPPVDVNLGYSVLNTIKAFNTTFLILTSRSYRVSELEKNLVTLAYELKPFNEASQKELLVKYWNSKGSNLNASYLDQYANLTISHLSEKLTNTENELAGVALQTKLIAEVYTANATAYASNDKTLHVNNDEGKPTFNVNSVYLVFEYIVHMKISSISKSESEERYQMYCHSYKAISERFLNENLPGEYICPNEVFEKIGLLERYDETTNLRFIHSSFIDYFISWYLLHCKQEDLCIKISNSYFALQNIMENYPTVFCIIEYTGFSFSEKLFVYFFDSAPTPKTEIVQYIDLSSLNKTSLLVAAVHDNFLSIFDLLQNHINSSNFEDVYRSSVLFSTDLFTIDYILEKSNSTGFGPLWNVITDCKFRQVFSSPFKISLVHLAILRGNKYIVNYFLSKETPNSWGKYFLHFCFSGKDVDDIQWVIESKERWITDRISIAETLIEMYPNMLEEHDHFACTPLTYTITYEFVIYLLEKGADLDAMCGNKSSIAWVISRASCSFTAEHFHDILKYLYTENQLTLKMLNDPYILLNYVSCSTPLSKTLYLFKAVGVDFDQGGISLSATMLFAALFVKRSFNSIEIITQYQTGWKAVGQKTGDTALLTAGLCNSIDGMKYFIEHSPEDINRIDVYNDTSLCHILTFWPSDNRLVNIKNLLKGGANPEFKCGPVGATPILLSAQYGPIKNFQALKNKCVSTCKPDSHGNTLLHYAISMCLETFNFRPILDQTLIVELIINDQLANVSARNFRNLTAIESSLFSTCSGEYPTLLLPTMHVLITQSDVILNDNIRYLLFLKAMRCPIPYVNDGINPYLEENLYATYVDSIQFYDINRKFDDAVGDTPLHVATKNECVNGVKYLINKGVNVNIQNKQGHTPLYYIDPNKLNYPRIKEVYDMLKNHGGYA